MNLRQWLGKTKISITDFANLIGIDRSYLHKILKGTLSPSEEVRKRISEITMDQVITKDELKGK